jgi:NADPH:quinone reductase-like Zn-dependent oxidoreductase
MRAVIIDPDPSHVPVAVGDWPDPVASPGWVLVRVQRAGLNRNDAMWVDERDLLPGRAVIGSDAAGTVQAVGRGVRGVDVGSDVVVSPSLWWGDGDEAPAPGFQLLGHPTQGTHAELVAVPTENVHPRPSRLTVDQAAALPLAGLTAWRALTTRGGLRAGETVVVTAASSGLGTFAVQMAAALGARVVGVTSTTEKAASARTLGAEAVVLRTSPTYPADLRDAVGPAGADLVVDSAGAQWPALLGALRRGGRLVALGRNAAPTADVDTETLFWRHLSVLGSSVGSSRDFAAMLEHVTASTWVPAVDEVVRLDDAAQAYSRLDAATRTGKVVLAVS